jgi:hypothetical protein
MAGGFTLKALGGLFDDDRGEQRDQLATSGQGPVTSSHDSLRRSNATPFDSAQMLPRIIRQLTQFDQRQLSLLP